MKKILLSFVVLIALFMVACTNNEGEETIAPPVFENVTNDKLAAITIAQGESFDLFEGVSAKSDSNLDVVVTIKSLGNFNPSVPSTYEIVYEASDSKGNRVTVKRDVIVTGTPVVDTLGPVFSNTVSGYIEPGETKLGVAFDLYEGVEAIDDIDGKVTVTIEDNDGFDVNKKGTYIIVYSATDSSGNKTTVRRIMNVIEDNYIEYDALVVNGNPYSYIYNNSQALDYTTSGTRFRLQDQIQVMDKAFFIDLYNDKKATHTNNGQVPFFPSGIIVLVDNNMNFKYLRAATPSVEIDGEGNVKTTGLDWSNSIDPTNGGGNFKNIIEKIEEELPNGGYVIFAPSRGEENSKKFLVRNFITSTFNGGTMELGDKIDVDQKNLEIKFQEDYREYISSDIYENAPKDVVVETDYILDGIPLTTYYYNDGEAKPLIFFFHGFSGERKAGIADRGQKLAQLGFFVVSMDAYLHGERTTKFFTDASYGDKQKEIVNIQMHTAQDAIHLYNKYYKNHQYIRGTEVYAMGVSMGGGTALYLASIMDNLNTVVSIVGSPSFVDFYRYKQTQYGWEQDSQYFTNLNSYVTHDPLINHHLLKDKNVYMTTGTLDTTVPEQFAIALKALYSNSNNIIHKSYDVAHTSTPAMMQEIYDYLETFIK